MSPIAGPPSTRRISAVLPPSSDTGSTCATLGQASHSGSAMVLKAVPPLNTTSRGGRDSRASQRAKAPSEDVSTAARARRSRLISRFVINRLELRRETGAAGGRPGWAAGGA
eukprot:2706793-Prymnesium_polylepis.2